MKLLQRFWVRISLWIAATILIFAALLVTWINRTGARQWRDAQEMLAREGETLDFRKLTHEPLPEEQNYCAIPALKDLRLVVDGDREKGEPGARRKRFQEAGLPEYPTSKRRRIPFQGRGAALGKSTDLLAWAAWLGSGSKQGDAPREVLTALSTREPLIAELTAGLSRTQAQWTPEWRSEELTAIMFMAAPTPKIRPMRQIMPILSLRGISAARSGDSRAAHDSLQIMLRLTKATLNDPFIISHFLGCVEAPQICDLTWELCASHSGTADDFRRAEEELAALDFRARLLHAFRTELAGSLSMVSELKKTRDPELISIVEPLGGSSLARLAQRLLMRAIPRGIFDMNAATIATLEFENMIKPIRHNGLAVAAEESQRIKKHFLELRTRRNFGGILAEIALPALPHVASRTAYAQSMVNMAIVACALERYRLKTGSYPESLAPVRLSSGMPLPLDICSEKSFGYRKTPNGRYALWSVGFDKKDDHGKRVLDAANPQKTKFQELEYLGDWVWDYQEQ